MLPALYQLKRFGITKKLKVGLYFIVVHARDGYYASMADAKARCSKMSRLDIFIDRMVSQKVCLEWAAQQIGDMDGLICELGLGNGRTYDHMREVLPGRDIFVFERSLAAHPSCIPPDDRLVIGDVHKTLPETLDRAGVAACLIHADLGGANLEKNDQFARELSPYVEPYLAPGALMISTDKMYFERLKLLPDPPGAVEGRCFIYRR